MALFLDEECGYKNDFVGENREWGKTDSLQTKYRDKTLNTGVE